MGVAAAEHRTAGRIFVRRLMIARLAAFSLRFRNIPLQDDTP